MMTTPEPWQYYEGDPSEDAADRLADAMGDATHPMHDELYEAQEEAFTRRYERERLGAEPDNIPQAMRNAVFFVKKETRPEYSAPTTSAKDTAAPS